MKNLKAKVELCQLKRKWKIQFQASYSMNLDRFGLVPRKVGTATCKREFKLRWREADPPHHHDDEVDSDQ